MVTAKRVYQPESTPTISSHPARRLKPSLTSMAPLRVANVEDGEIIHQPCLLLVGGCPHLENSALDHVSVAVEDSLQTVKSFHKWPVAEGRWKALILLSPGTNSLAIDFHHAGNVSGHVDFSISYQPLLQLPPLHLAIMVAKDSPLLVDCPPSKYGAFTTAHTGLDSAIGKLRMTALMWQALTAEDMREKGLGRRAFRLEEEWAANTLTLAGSSRNAGEGRSLRSIPKVHIVRCDKTVEELRTPAFAQQNALHAIFSKALKVHGPPFEAQYHPVVAGMILDSHYSIEKEAILGHAALGYHCRDGLSLGIFGSHLTYSWPRFLDEIPACLVDETLPGDSVGNENNECNTISQACWVGQGAFLQEVGHAFDAQHTQHTTGIMARGYSKSWSRGFLATPDSTANVATWSLQDCLRFKSKPHFRLPGEQPATEEFLSATVHIQCHLPQGCDDATLQLSSAAGLAHVVIKNGSETKFLWSGIGQSLSHEISVNDFSSYDRALPLHITALALNGVEKTEKNGWRLFAQKDYISIPGSKLRLQKRSIKSFDLDDEFAKNPDEYIQWTVLLGIANDTETIAIATGMDLRVGATFDGAVVHYSDGRSAHCGPIFDREGFRHEFGGHQSEYYQNKNGLQIIKVEIGHQWDWGRLDGIRMTDESGHEWGAVNISDDNKVDILEPEEDEEIVGFFGKSHKAGEGYVEEFGIITTPKGVELPGVVWEMPELQNLVQDRDDESQKTMA